MTFPPYLAHTDPLFKSLEILPIDKIFIDRTGRGIILIDDWNQNINNISRKVNMYVNNHADRALKLQLESCLTCVIQMIDRSLVIASSNS